MMMLRLARAGAKKRPVYHLVAADRRSRRDGRHVEQLGYYIPARDIVVVNQERIDYWMARGAQPSETVGRLIKTVKKHGNTEPAVRPAYEPPPAKPAEASKADTESPEAAATATGSEAPEAAATATGSEAPGGEAASEAETEEQKPAAGTPPNDPSAGS